MLLYQGFCVYLFTCICIYVCVYITVQYDVLWYGACAAITRWAMSHTWINISPKSGPFRRMVCVVVSAPFVQKRIFWKSKKSWPKTWWALVTWVWFRISQNIYNVRARWVAKTAARFHHSKFETNPPRLRYHFIALFGLMVTSHMWIRHVSHINGHMHEPCLTYKWVLNHIWLSHVSHVNETDAIQLYDAALLLLQDALFYPLLVAKVCLNKCINSCIYVCICMCIYIRYLH